jgi:hypothetical protein
MATRESKPKCPWCSKRSSYQEATELDERGYAVGMSRCPHCSGKMVWSQSFGVLTANGLVQTPARPTWSRGYGNPLPLEQANDETSD